MYLLVFSENKPSAWLEASRTQGLCVFLLGQTEINRRVFICDWEGRELGSGVARGQETLPVGSGGAGNVPTVSCS